ncbi:MAG: TonB-dependent receptor plug domain-containing protein [Gammaproteobacteria bacterium]
MLSAVSLCALQAQAQDTFSPQQLAGLSLEDLANLEITSVSRRSESVSAAPASIYVITSDDIRRSGATSIPEVLRLAPNLQVARIDSVQYAISARGFNNAVGNKLLVLLDGRTLYTPLFSGVFWEMEDTLLQDIERIEVISGVGATLWGANAVNGVINIITRAAVDTQGLLLTAAGGDREHGGGLRAGGELGSAQVRVYAKARHWDNTNRENGADVADSWNRAQAGFRADWSAAGGSVTLQGDVYDGEGAHRGFFGTAEIPAVAISGANLLARWTRALSADSNLRVQAYWNHRNRDEAFLFSPKADIFDLELQHDVALGAHRVVWGGGYRHAEDDVGDGLFTAFIPDSRELRWQNLFAQDEFALDDNLRAIVGMRLEWNDYTGLEYLPSARLAWTLAEEHHVWAAVSRAVRAPSRYDRDVFLPKQAPFLVAGGPQFAAEVAKVVDIGYRGQLTRRFNLSATVFHHDWDNLRSGTLPPPPTYLANDIEGESYGLEAWFTWEVASGWRVSGGMTALGKELRFRPGGGDTVGVDNPTLHNDPDYQWTLRSSVDLRHDVMLDLNLRRVAALIVEPVPAYSELNARLAWQPRDDLELALVGYNLLDNDHAEFGAFASRSRIDRSALLEVRWLH